MNVTDNAILKLALPSIVSNITVPLLGLVDLAIVGHIGSETYIGAIAVGSMIFNVIYWIFGFLRMGNSGMASQALEKVQKKRCKGQKGRQRFNMKAKRTLYVVARVKRRGFRLRCACISSLRTNKKKGSTAISTIEP